ncbi:MAG TPA: hypothetical protein VLX91_10475 [Candidatus Acidoferrales bacterium]|nr:hypothetical protein [Candidatus Acidoferrales bacterium]
MVDKLVRYVREGETVIAVMIRKDFTKDGIHFFTEGESSQQLAFMKHPKGYIIQPHVHNPFSRQIRDTMEVIFIRKGVLRVDFYSRNRVYLESSVLTEGDVLMLVSGGHGFQALEEVEMFEVKQGPYAGEADKTKFKNFPDENLRII